MVLLKVHEIPGITEARLELLEAAGFLDVSAVSAIGVDDLTDELRRANHLLKILPVPPSREEVAQWIVSARELVGGGESVGCETADFVNYEQSQQVADLLVSAPYAIPLPARVLVENHVGVAEIPPAIMLNRYSGDLDVRTDQWRPQGQSLDAASSGSLSQAFQYVKIADDAPSRLEIDTSRIRSLDSQVQVPQRNVPSKRAKEEPNDRLTLLRAPKPSTNKGRDPKSRRYIRGVLHTHPVSIWFGALITLIISFLLPAGIVSAFLLLLSDQSPDHFAWVPRWLIGLPIALPIVGMMYLIWGVGGTCRICGQKLFFHRPHRKHIKAHHVRFLGYILPLCLHILLFRWFRCTHCGTPVRLKE